MSLWRSSKASACGTARPSLAVDHHVEVLSVFRTILSDPAVYDPNAGTFEAGFLANAELRYSLYLKLLLEDGKLSSTFLPPWDVALIFYSHLLFPTIFADHLQQGVWGLRPTDSLSLPQVLRRLAFPVSQLARLSTQNNWTDSCSSFEWEQSYPTIPYQPWARSRDGRVVRMPQQRPIVGVALRCPKCGASSRCSPSEWRSFRTSDRTVPCRRANCHPIRYEELAPQFRSPWTSLPDLAEVILRAMGGADAFLVAPELQSKLALRAGLPRYDRFMSLLKEAGPEKRPLVLAPTADIDLCWRTHRIMPAEYRAWCAKNLGRYVDDDECGGHHIYAGGCEELTMTEELWEARYGEPYLQRPPLSRLRRLVAMVSVSLSDQNRAAGRKGRNPPQAPAPHGIPSFVYQETAYARADSAPPRSESTAPTPRSDATAANSSRTRSNIKKGRKSPPVETRTTAAAIDAVAVAAEAGRRVSETTMFPLVGRGNRGSFVTTATATENQDRKWSRHSKRVSVLPAIKSIDDMNGGPVGQQLSRVEVETGLHRSGSRIKFGEAVARVRRPLVPSPDPSAAARAVADTGAEEPRSTEVARPVEKANTSMGRQQADPPAASPPDAAAAAAPPADKQVEKPSRSRRASEVVPSSRLPRPTAEWLSPSSGSSRPGFGHGRQHVIAAAPPSAAVSRPSSCARTSAESLS